MSQQINLFDPTLQKQRDVWTASTLGVSLLVMCIIVATCAGWAHAQKSDVEAEVANLKPQVETGRATLKQLGDQYANRKPDASLEAELADARARLAARSQVLAILNKGLAPEATGQADLLRGFGRQVPSGLWLTAFDVDADTGALDVRGRTNDPALIPEYVKRLGNERAFRGRTFSALDIKGPAAPPSTLLGAASVPAPAPNAAAPFVVAAATAAGPAAKAGETAYHEFLLRSTQVGNDAAGIPNLKGSKP